jgi:hypothetical protein
MMNIHPVPPPPGTQGVLKLREWTPPGTQGVLKLREWTPPGTQGVLKLREWTRKGTQCGSLGFKTPWVPGDTPSELTRESRQER